MSDFEDNTRVSSRIEGSIVALVTPMHEDGAVDYQTLKNLVGWHRESGTAGIVAVGTSGESATLDVAEHAEVIRCVVEAAAGSLAVIAGTGANSTTEAIELTREAAKVGADACLSVTPYYNKPTQEGLYRHHLTIAEAVDIPNILYNVPGRTAVDMEVETTWRLSQVPNIVGIKDATGDPHRGEELLQRFTGQHDGQFSVYSGDDGTAAELMIKGGAGNISVTANVIPAKMAELCRLAIQSFRKGDETMRERALALDNSLQTLHAAMFVESNPIPVKWALYRMGKIENGIRLPLTPLSSEYHQQLDRVLAEQGVIDLEIA